MDQEREHRTMVLNAEGEFETSQHLADALTQSVGIPLHCNCAITRRSSKSQLRKFHHGCPHFYRFDTPFLKGLI